MNGLHYHLCLVHWMLRPRAGRHSGLWLSCCPKLGRTAYCVRYGASEGHSSCLYRLINPCCIYHAKNQITLGHKSEIEYSSVSTVTKNSYEKLHKINVDCRVEIVAFYLSPVFFSSPDQKNDTSENFRKSSREEKSAR